MGKKTEKIIWVTRWALTKGIKKVEARVDDDESYASYKDSDQYGSWSVYLGSKDFHMTEKAAKERAQEMAAKKIVSVEKQLVRLKNLTF